MSDAQDEEERRRRQEINFFAAMAVGEDDVVMPPPPPPPPPTSPQSQSQSTSMPRSGSAVSLEEHQPQHSSLHKYDNENDYDDDEHLLTTPKHGHTAREAFISAALAAPDIGFDSGTFRFSKPTTTTTTSSTTAEKMTDNNNNNKAEQESNLQAAAAALAAESSLDNNNSSSHMDHLFLQLPVFDDAAAMGQSATTTTTTTTIDPTKPPVRVSEEQNVPMFAEQVVMPRPLFFGAILPPRVVKEAVEMVQTAVTEYQQQQQQQQSHHRSNSTAAAAAATTATATPRLSQLPPAVRNVVGAIRTFGFGIDVFALATTTTTTTTTSSGADSAAGGGGGGADSAAGGGAKVVITDQQQEQQPIVVENFRGSPWVSTFQPVWGHDIRAARVAKCRKLRRKPDAVSQRATTAPARLFEDTLLLMNSGNKASSAPSSVVGTVLEEDEGEGAHEQPQPPARPLSDNEQFSMWIRGDDEASGSLGHMSATESISSIRSLESLTSPTPAAAATTTATPTGGDSSAPITTESATEQEQQSEQQQQQQPATPLSEQALFSHWARGSSDGGTVRSSLGGGETTDSSMAYFDGNTFRRRSPSLPDSDEDSVKEDELKKQVGLSDHLSKAIASLVEDQQAPVDIVINPSQVLLSQIPQDESRQRPLTNFELTNGCVPIFGDDDPPLPDSADLGSFETKDEQARTQEMKRSQEIIDRFVPPNVFGTVACPNPATGPDDCHSWNSRAPTSGRIVLSGSSVADHASVASAPLSKRSSSEPMMTPPVPTDRSVARSVTTQPLSTTGGKKRRNKPSRSSSRASRVRRGWWNVTEEESAPYGGSTVDSLERASTIPDTASKLHIPPSPPDTLAPLVTHLEPSPEKLREDNLPLSRLHAATSMEQTLPFLSDRPPSYRYLQIDTQAIGFPPVKGEIEPLFCSLAIYNVETVSGAPGGEQTPAPIPDLQRCGRVTESLYFDVAADENIAERCAGALWPYEEGEKLEGTRCGVFPLPSNLNVANLYAVLIVRKVLASEPCLDPYVQPGRNVVDLEKLRSSAEKAALRHGQFLMPFAFGVAPLLQVFGADNPLYATSRAVQIPLFRFKGEERQIIDHIMVMLYPRADHKAIGIGGPAPVTNGGTAMLVMRNFGYLGLHVAIDNKSSLARERLVDFTGELQVRRKTEDENELPFDTEDHPYFCERLPEWRPRFIAEPVKDGGRYFNKKNETDPDTQQQLYAQEMAPIPLELSPLLRTSATTKLLGVRARLHGNDIEPFYHTTFCNELLCCPRVMHNCPKKTTAVKVELRELEWNEGINSHLAHLPECSKAIHNTRRGPFLVEHAFSTCSTRNRSREHHFIDDFKVKLPLDLKPRRNDGTARNLVLLFTVYSVKVSSKSMWKRAMMLTGDASAETLPLDPSGKSTLEQIACGFLPISTSSSRVLDDGVHHVRVVFKARSPSKDLQEQEIVPSTTLVLVEQKEPVEHPPQLGRDDSYADDTIASGDSKSSDKDAFSEAGALTEVATGSELGSITGDSSFASGRVSSFAEEPIALSVRVVVHSSLHAQNDVLSEFLSEEPDLPSSLCQNNINNFLFTAQMHRSSLVRAVDMARKKKDSSLEEHLVQATISTTDPHLCSMPSSSPFLMRTLSILWRQFICGYSQPDLVWANPASIIPLRIHSFASMLHLLGGTCLHLAKNGATQLDGRGKLTITTLSRVVVLLFDEGKLFGKQAFETVEEDYLDKLSVGQKLSPNRKSPNRRARHVRNTLDLYNQIQEVRSQELGGDRDVLSSIAGELVSSVAPSRRPKKSEEREIDLFSEMKALETTWERGSPSTSQSNVEKNEDVKIDSKSDFQSALRAAVASSDEDFDRVQKGGTGAAAAQAMISAYSDLPSGSSRKWMTAPAAGRALSTIREFDEGDESSEIFREESEELPTPVITKLESSPPDDDNAITKQKKGVRQFRIPNLDKDKREKSKTDDVETSSTSASVQSSSTLTSIPKSDDEIETAGLPFLEVIGKSLGMGSSLPEPADEGRSVGSSHHRKTRSRSSIDWSLMMDQGNSPGGQETPPPTLTENVPQGDENDRMSTLAKEEASAISLPTFLDRLRAMGAARNTSARWFPYAYEVIILQWAAVLSEQRRLGKHGESGEKQDTNTDKSMKNDDALSQGALRSIGVAVAGAPMLLEIIKQSLGFRITKLFREHLVHLEGTDCPPLVKLDDILLSSLEQIIKMITDVCLDSRNFDSWELRQTSVDVNDSVVRFLRDMFSFLAPGCVHRLILAYFSRFKVNASKGFQDKDSSIGLRVSWEISKLRLNAVTMMVRYPDLIRVNSPQMLNWGLWWTDKPIASSDDFYDSTLRRYEQFGLRALIDGDIPTPDPLPSMKPHWLAELLTDICLLGTEHVEQYIQNRSASLVHELFWICSQEGIFNGISAPVSSMFVTFLEKLLSRVSYLSSFSPKSQLRKDLLPCVVFVLQGAAPGLLRALWRRLCTRVEGAGQLERYRFTSGSGGIEFAGSDSLLEGYRSKGSNSNGELRQPDALDMYSLLNLTLRTLEFEGSEEHIELESGESRDNVEVWRKEYLLSPSNSGPRHETRTPWGPEKSQTPEKDAYTSSVSRRWQAHDASIVVVNTGHQIVLEMYRVLRKCPTGKSFLNPAVNQSPASPRFLGDSVEDEGRDGSTCGLCYADVVLFVRAATSLYLQTLALRESDLAITRTLKLAAELIKIFGIRIFLEAVGQTLQHWMRVVLLHCGARRATVRIESTDLLELVLRSTWECFGSFFRIRVPLLAVQTEVMERIVATAAARYYREQRRHGMVFEPFSNVSAEASLVPLWRTFDRIETQPASQNVAFRGALIRMAGKLKTLYRAYVAARVLSFLHGSQGSFEEGSDQKDYNTEARIRANRISILRVINQSEGHSKQFLGVQGTRQHRSRVAHFEAVEDALIDAANVFSPSELPEHRVAWLRMLADFHASRKKYAEEATCHFHIHMTLYQAARLHGALWSNTPFLPWTDNMPDPVYIDGDTPPDPDYQSDFELDDVEEQYGRRLDNASSFRRIFYRVANSVVPGNSDWQAGASKNLFCGLAFPSEYHSISPWISLQEMEEDMVEESELAAELFLRAGIVENSRLAWNLAAQYYSEKFNYPKLALTYGNLSRAIISQVPRIDSSLPQEVSDNLGRFYRVWFHGGAPDELSGVEFVYRTEGTVSLDQFGEDLEAVIKSIIPDNTPIHLLLDGHTDDRFDDGAANYGFSRMGQPQLDPVKIKVTRLRPLFGKLAKARGLPEWFLHYVDEAFSGSSSIHQGGMANSGGLRRAESSPSGGVFDGLDATVGHSRSFSASVYSVNSWSTIAVGQTRVSRALHGVGDRSSRLSGTQEGELSGVDRFCFIHARDRSKGSKDWWKAAKGNFMEKSLKVTQLQVAQPFPACSARQVVIHRLVYSISPLEAGIDTVCQWCSMLFRTAVATVGMAVLGTATDPGIGTDAAKVVADSIHSSHVKEIGIALLRSSSELNKDESTSEFALEFDHLSEHETRTLQVKMARLVVVFLELLHILIARNRDILLEVIQERKKGDLSSRGGAPGGSRPNSVVGNLSLHTDRSGHGRSSSAPSARIEPPSRRLPLVGPPGLPTTHRRQLMGSDAGTDGRSTGKRSHARGTSDDVHTVNSTQSGGGLRTDSAIAVQSELQRAFINLTKTLYQKIHGILQSDTPRWLKQCSQENYFSMGYYRHTKIPIADELCLRASEMNSEGLRTPLPGRPHAASESGYESPRGSIGGGSSHSVVSRGSERYGLGQF